MTEVDDATGASVLKALTTHYLVTQTRTGGTLTALTPPVTGTTWRIARSTPKPQPNQLRLSGAFNPEVVEAMIDRPVMQIPELGGEIDRDIRSGDGRLGNRCGSKCIYRCRPCTDNKQNKQYKKH